MYLWPLTTNKAQEASTSTFLVISASECSSMLHDNYGPVGRPVQVNQLYSILTYLFDWNQLLRYYCVAVDVIKHIPIDLSNFLRPVSNDRRCTKKVNYSYSHSNSLTI